MNEQTDNTGYESDTLSVQQDTDAEIDTFCTTTIGKRNENEHYRRVDSAAVREHRVLDNNIRQHDTITLSNGVMTCTILILVLFKMWVIMAMFVLYFPYSNSDEI